MQLNGRVAVVTGAASGIGAATARALAARGARLVLVDLAEAPLHALGTELGAALVRRVDVSRQTEVESLAAAVQAELGGAAVLVNNAGVTVVGPFEHHTDADWDRVMGVNFYGVLHGCRAFLPQLRAQPAGWIVNVSSLFGLLGVPGQTAYCASKYAVRGLSEALHEELRGGTVGLTVVHPGGVRTGIVRSARATESMEATSMARVGAFFDRYGVPPERVAGAITRAIEAERHRVLVCPETTAVDLLRRVAPVLGNRHTSWAITGMVGLGKSR